MTAAQFLSGLTGRDDDFRRAIEALRTSGQPVCLIGGLAVNHLRVPSADHRPYPHRPDPRGGCDAAPPATMTTLLHLVSEPTMPNRLPILASAGAAGYAGQP